ncbi:MAG: L-threonylcarbamoyladenylate synthase [Pseudanabaenaceae cyanobacterium bins.39]|nr:L-threonylcarbamoyladenylate synthase [Pseudanabaenaceae cyanobacterium bins.39]
MSLVSTVSLIAGARSGCLVSFPTDTVPALAVRPDRGSDIYTLKQRSPDKPLILMAASWSAFLPFLAVEQPHLQVWQEMAQKYLPGALTLVLPASELGQQLNQGFPTLGVRIPDSQVAIAILQQTGALLTTSANQSNHPPLRQLQQIHDSFPSVLVLAEGIDIHTELGSGSPSTVVEWVDEQWVVRRQGSVYLD